MPPGFHFIYVLLAGVLVAALCAPVMPAMAQVPDNRGLKLDPEDSVAPAYRDTLDRRDRQRLDAAREAGDSFIPLIQGRGRAPGESSHRYTGAETSPERVPPRSGLLPPKPAYEAYRRPHLVVPEPQDSAERGLSDLMNVLIETWSRPPEIVRLRYPPTPERLPADTDVDADRPEAPLLLLASIGPGRGLYARTRSMRSIRTIRVRCCWSCWSRRWPARWCRARSRWWANAWCCASTVWNTGAEASPSTPGRSVSIAPVTAFRARSTGISSSACCCPPRCVSRKAS